jgi:hypothetical protein
MFCTIFQLIRNVVGGVKELAERAGYLLRTRRMVFAQAPGGEGARGSGLEPRRGVVAGRLPVMRGGGGEGGRGARDAQVSRRKGGPVLGGTEAGQGARQARVNHARHWVMTRKGFYIGM